MATPHRHDTHAERELRHVAADDRQSGERVERPRRVLGEPVRVDARGRGVAGVRGQERDIAGRDELVAVDANLHGTSIMRCSNPRKPGMPRRDAGVGVSASANSGYRSKSMFRATIASSLPRCIPRQWCSPPPNAAYSLRGRVTEYVSGSGFRRGVAPDRRGHQPQPGAGRHRVPEQLGVLGDDAPRRQRRRVEAQCLLDRLRHE